MRLLRQHHITNLIAVIDEFVPRQEVGLRSGRPIILHHNKVIGLLLFSSMVAPQKTLK